MLNKSIIGIDIGSAKIHAGLVVGENVVKEYKINSPKSNDKSVLIAALKMLINKLMFINVDGIGIGIPGVVDCKNGVVRKSNNYSVLNGINLRKILEEEFKMPVYLNNDANCFVIGEKHFGFGKDYKNIVGLTLGTGMGGGIIINGKLYSGNNCGAGEFCSVKYKEHDLEYYCSGKFFTNEYDVSALNVYNLARNGDKKSMAIYEEFGMHLGEAIYTVLFTINPELIVIGGSVAKAHKFFEKSLFEVLERVSDRQIVESLSIKFRVESNSAILGAGGLFYEYN